jgi:hypothetical protein
LVQEELQLVIARALADRRFDQIDLLAGEHPDPWGGDCRVFHLGFLLRYDSHLRTPWVCEMTPSWCHLLTAIVLLWLQVNPRRRGFYGVRNGRGSEGIGADDPPDDQSGI